MEEPLSNEISWDKPYYYLDGKPLVPYVLDEPFRQIGLVDGFNTVILKIDGQLQANLDWKEIGNQAREWINRGYYLFWEIDLGLFSRLSKPLTNQTQYLALTLSLEHFRDTLWKEFNHKTLGLCLYRGSADFALHFPWDEQQEANLRGWIQDHFLTIEAFEEETQLSIPSFNQLTVPLLLESENGRRLVSLFCRDVAVEYMALLASRLPDALPRYLLLDATSIGSPLFQAQLLHPERFDHFSLAIKNSPLPFQALGWNQPSIFGIIGALAKEKAPTQAATLGICLPVMNKHCATHYEGLEEALNLLLDKKVPFRLISESHLTTEWDGLDDLLYNPQGLSIQGRRKLQGFCAAGGRVVTLSDKSGFSQEILWFEWVEKYCEK